MANIQIKIVGVEGDSVLVKYASEKSAKNIDEYDAVAFQPKMLGFTTLDVFVKEIGTYLLPIVKLRDASENVDVVGMEAWVGYEGTQVVVEPEPVVTTMLGNIPAVLDTTNEVQL